MYDLWNCLAEIRLWEVELYSLIWFQILDEKSGNCRLIQHIPPHSH